MTLLSSMYTGVTGIQSNGLSISVIGDNIANVNTVGFKASRGNFADTLQQNILGSTNTISQLGGGSTLSNVQTLYTQGSLSNTGVSTDLAISGSGFFILNGNYNGINGNFYSRAGEFTINDEGYLVNPNGLMVQGYMADPNGQLIGTLSNLNLTAQNVPPRATAQMDLTANLNSADSVLAAAWDPANPATTSNFNSTITVYDSLGNSHGVEVYFRKTAANTWDWHAMVDGGDLTGGTAGTPTEIGTGNLAFTTDGRLNTVTGNTITANFVGATAGQAMTINFGDAIAAGGTGIAGSTQFSSASSINYQHQDGYTTGSLQQISINPDGTIVGSFSNGITRNVAQIALANFQNSQGLNREGGNLYIQSTQSGEPLIGAATTGSRGSIKSNSLEQSNVDLAEQFINLIAAQRGFEASSKVITTSDQMLSELMNIHR